MERWSHSCLLRLCRQKGRGSSWVVEVRRGREKEQGGSHGRSENGTLGIVKTKADGNAKFL